MAINQGLNTDRALGSRGHHAHRDSLREAPALAGSNDAITRRNHGTGRKLNQSRRLGVVSGQAKTEMYQRADVLVLPSYMEGFSMAILEAMWLGAAIVSTTVGSNPDIVREGENGFLIEPGDNGALERKLESLLADSQMRKRIGRHNLSESRDKYSIESVVETLLETFPNIRLSEEPLTWCHSGLFRGLDSLPVIPGAC